jgi:hypothetical protein
MKATRTSRAAVLTLALAAIGMIPGAARTSAAPVRAAEVRTDDEAGAITARVHGTFQDAAGGLGVLSGDMTIARFEVRNGAVTALGEIVGSLADAAGNVLGRVKQPLALPVANVASTCNQVRMDLAGTDAEVLQTPVHFDKEVAGFDSREGTTPKALGVLCAAEALLRGGQATPDSLVRALNDIAIAAASSDGR